MAFLLAFARRFDHYLPQREWKRGPAMMDLPALTVLIVGVGGAGAETGKLCAALGMRVLGCDPRVRLPRRAWPSCSRPTGWRRAWPRPTS